MTVNSAIFPPRIEFTFFRTISTDYFTMACYADLSLFL